MEEFTRQQLEWIEVYGGAMESFGKLAGDISGDEAVRAERVSNFEAAFLSYQRNVPQGVRRTFSRNSILESVYNGYQRAKKR